MRTSVVTRRAGRAARPAGRSGGGAVGSRLAFNYIYIVPATVLMLALIYYSIGYTLWLSVFDWNGLGPNREYVGFANYSRALRDPIFWRAIGNVTLFFALVFVTMALGLFFAVLLHSRIRFKAVYKVVLFLPVVLAPAVMAPVFRSVFSPKGAVNQLLTTVGLAELTHAWLADPHTAIYVLMLITIWGGTGFSFVLYYAGITQIDPQIFEAARVDGAGTWRQLTSITVPMLRRTHITLLVLGTISILKVFDVPQLVTGGGPANSTQFLGTFIYQQGVNNYAAGYAAAITVILVVLCVVLAATQLTLSRRGDRS